jgi:hypothetical protein
MAACLKVSIGDPSSIRDACLVRPDSPEYLPLRYTYRIWHDPSRHTVCDRRTLYLLAQQHFTSPIQAGPTIFKIPCSHYKSKSFCIFIKSIVLRIFMAIARFSCVGIFDKTKASSASVRKNINNLIKQDVIDINESNLKRLVKSLSPKDAN